MSTAVETPNPDLVLRTRDLVAGYVPDIDILNGVSVDVWRGQVRVVLGPNGTGKSTLLKVIFGFLRARRGSVRMGEQELVNVPPHSMGDYGIAYLPQRPSLFPFLSVDTNLRLGTWRFRRNRAEVRRRIEEALEQFPILRDRRSQAAGTMSGGQQRQLEIARSLMTNPSVLLMDEPTASIEPRITGQIYALIAELARTGRAVLLVDQNIKGALGIADYVYVLRTGALFDEGPRAAFDEEVEALVARWLYTR